MAVFDDYHLFIVLQLHSPRALTINCHDLSTEFARALDSYTFIEAEAQALCNETYWTSAQSLHGL